LLDGGLLRYVTPHSNPFSFDLNLKLYWQYNKEPPVRSTVRFHFEPEGGNV